MNYVDRGIAINLVMLLMMTIVMIGILMTLINNMMMKMMVHATDSRNNYDDLTMTTSVLKTSQTYLFKSLSFDLRALSNSHDLNLLSDT